MPDHPNPEPILTAGSQTPPAHPSHGVSQAPLTPDQLRRWAPLIAEGQDQFPQNLGPEDREELLQEVRRLLRERLIRLVARATAVHLDRKRKQ